MEYGKIGLPFPDEVELGESFDDYGLDMTPINTRARTVRHIAENQPISDGSAIGEDYMPKEKKITSFDGWPKELLIALFLL